MRLYYIALILPSTLRQKIRTIQQDFQVRYKVAHALKSPPHITLQKPFKRNEAQETSILSALDTFAMQQNSFKIELQSFSHFNQKVVYIDIKNASNIILLAKQLQRVLIPSIQLAVHEQTHITKPHITLAARDMDTAIFSKIWRELKATDFSATCTIDSIYLLKHNGSTWDILHRSYFIQ